MNRSTEIMFAEETSVKMKGRAKRATAIPAAALALLAIFLCRPAEVRAQWTTGTNINNTNTGNVGVGTSNPGTKLDINGDARVQGGSTTNSFAFYFSTSGATNRWHIQYYNGGLNFVQTGTGERVFFQDGGNVGIGTTSPAYKLHVVGGSIVVQGATAGGASGNADFAIRTASGNGFWDFATQNTNGTFILYDAINAKMPLTVEPNAPTNALYVSATGAVGIGTASPTSKLHVVGGSITVQGATAGGASGNADFAIRTASGNGYWDFATQNTNGTFILYDAINAKMPLTVEPNAPTNTLYLKASGVVGIGTATPGAGSSDPQLKLDVQGNINVSGNINAKYQDVAEWVPSTQKLVAGTVVVLDTDKTNHVMASTTSYDTKVAGVVSAQPGITLGEGGEGKALVATTGRVKVKVDATRAAIHVGDLLVTSDTEGVAMKSEPVEISGRKMHAPGTIIGKALEPLASGTGEILVLLSLQ